MRGFVRPAAASTAGFGPLLSLLFVFASGCSTQSPCSAALCDGCCDSAGRCLSGTAESACGAKGVGCMACAIGDVCFGGACKATAACARSEDCLSVACRCGDGANVETRSCKSGRCLTPGELCDGACTNAGHPKPGDSDGGTPGYSFCVDGTASSCFGDDLDWSGGQCCVTVGYGQCVNGTAAACFGADLEWTGSTCCVKSGFGPCVDGTVGLCNGADLAWTGLSCCVRDRFQLCTEGLQQQCGGDDLVWTGTKCCAAIGYTQCTEGTLAACTGANMKWTGQKCCVKAASSCVDSTQVACTASWTGSKCCT